MSEGFRKMPVDQVVVVVAHKRHIPMQRQRPAGLLHPDVPGRHPGNVHKAPSGSGFARLTPRRGDFGSTFSTLGAAEEGSLRSSDGGFRTLSGRAQATLSDPTPAYQQQFQPLVGDSKDAARPSLSPASLELARVLTPVEDDASVVVAGTRSGMNRVRREERAPSAHPANGDRPKSPAGGPPARPPDDETLLGTPEEPEGRTIAQRHPDWNLEVTLLVGAHGTKEDSLAGGREYIEDADIILFENPTPSSSVEEILQEAAAPPDSSVEDFLTRTHERGNMLEPNIRKFFGTGAIVRQFDIRPGDEVSPVALEQNFSSEYMFPTDSFEETLAKLLRRSVEYVALQNGRDDITVHRHLEPELVDIFTKYPSLQEIMKKRPLRIIIARGEDHRFRMDQALREEGITPNIVFSRKSLIYTSLEQVNTKLLSGEQPSKDDLARAFMEEMIERMNIIAFSQKIGALKPLDNYIEGTEGMVIKILEEVMDSLDWMKSEKYARYLELISSNITMQDIQTWHNIIVLNVQPHPQRLDELIRRNGLTVMPTSEDELDSILDKLEEAKATASN